MENLRYYLMPIAKVLLFGVFILLCAVPFTLIEVIDFKFEGLLSPLGIEIISQITGVLMVLGALLMVFRVFSQYHFKHVFIVWKNSWQGFLKGTAIGFALLSCCVLLAFINGNVTFTKGSFHLTNIIGYMILYILVGIVEELVFRSFPLLAFAERYRSVVAIFLTSFLFGFAHYYNPGFSWLAMLNISLIGVLLAMYVLQKRNLFWAIGIHFGWNFTQGILMGYKVSGTDAVGLLVAKPLGKSYFSGGNFGIEASLFCTLITIVVITYLLKTGRSMAVEEVLAEQVIEEEENYEPN